MDIDILLALQQLREGPGGCLAEFFSKMTWFGEMNVVLVIMALIYWCADKDTGTYLLMGWNGNRIVNGVLKVAVCAYRPWIRDARIAPYPAALQTATGYSFPSGHSMNAASLFGGMAVRKGIKTGFRVLLWIMLGLVAFSRIYFGVHTPQDILVGSAAGVLVMFLTGKLMVWFESHPDKDILIAVIGIAIAIASAVFSALKPYPADFDANGKLLVDGLKMANDTFKAVGWISAFFVGWVLERRFVGFTTDAPLMKRVTRLAVGLFLFYIVSLILVPQLKAWIPGPAGTTISCFVQMFYIAFLFPLLIRRMEK